MTMKFNQITESIIKVPPELLNTVNMYVSSMIVYKLNQFLSRYDLMMAQKQTPEQKQQTHDNVKQTIAKLQQKYNAKNISSSTAQNIDGKSIELNINFDKFFSELNYKGITPEMISYVKNNIQFELYITGANQDSAGAVSRQGDRVSLMVHTARLNGLKPLETANEIMRTTYHECQHVVQEFAIKTIDLFRANAKPNKQLTRGDDYTSGSEEYFSSGVEYTPQLGDVINHVSDILERDAIAGKLNPNTNKAINNAIVDAYQESANIRAFLGTIRKNNPDGYKKALKAIYSKAVPVHNFLVNHGVDYRYSDLDPVDLEANVNVMATILEMVHKKSSEFKLSGTKRGKTYIRLNIESVKNGWKISISPENDNNYSVSLTYGDYYDSALLDSQKVLNFIGIITSSPYYDADDILSDLDMLADSGKEVTNEHVSSMIQNILGDAKYFGIPVSEEGNNFSIDGLQLKLEPYQDDKTKFLLTDASGELYFVLPSSKVLMLLQAFVIAVKENPEEAKRILTDFNSYIKKITDLRNL